MLDKLKELFNEELVNKKLFWLLIVLLGISLGINVSQQNKIEKLEEINKKQKASALSLENQIFWSKVDFGLEAGENLSQGDICFYNKGKVYAYTTEIIQEMNNGAGNNVLLFMVGEEIKKGDKLTFLNSSRILIEKE